MPTVYPPLAIGAARRLAIFKREAARPGWVRPMTWRDVRFATLKSHSRLSQGFNDGTPVWCTYDGAQFRNERFASDILPRMRYTGWFGDTENQEKLYRGIVASLPHGRFLAGYLAEDNDERVYYPELFDSEDEAARTSDEHARVAAECEDEYSQRWNQAMQWDALIESKESDLRKAHEELRLAISATQGARVDSLAWMRARTAQAKALEWARSIIGDIRGFRDERAALKVD